MERPGRLADEDGARSVALLAGGAAPAVATRSPGFNLGAPMSSCRAAAAPMFVAELQCGRSEVQLWARPARPVVRRETIEAFHAGGNETTLERLDLSADVEHVDSAGLAARAAGPSSDSRRRGSPSSCSSDSRARAASPRRAAANRRPAHPGDGETLLLRPPSSDVSTPPRCRLSGCCPATTERGSATVAGTASI